MLKHALSTYYSQPHAFGATCNNFTHLELCQSRRWPVQNNLTCSSPISVPSLSLIFAISKICFRDIVPATSVPAFPLPLVIPAARLSSKEVGGVLIVKENVRSGLTVTKVGVGIPGSRCAVLALNSWRNKLSQNPHLYVYSHTLAKSIAFTPLAPSAGPTGGCALALPAGTSSLTSWAAVAAPFFDMVVVNFKFHEAFCLLSRVVIRTNSFDNNNSDKVSFCNPRNVHKSSSNNTGIIHDKTSYWRLRVKRETLRQKKLCHSFWTFACFACDAESEWSNHCISSLRLLTVALMDGTGSLFSYKSGSRRSITNLTTGCFQTLTPCLSPCPLFSATSLIHSSSACILVLSVTPLFDFAEFLILSDFDFCKIRSFDFFL